MNLYIYASQSGVLCAIMAGSEEDANCHICNEVEFDLPAVLVDTLCEDGDFLLCETEKAFIGKPTYSPKTTIQ